MRMVGGRLRCLSCFFTCSSVLLVGVCLHGAYTSDNVEGSSCQHVIHKKVGETVELSSCLPAEGVTTAKWRHKNMLIADKDIKISAEKFEGRLYLNPTNLSLTVRGLTLQDSGDFSFVSAVYEDKQRKTVIITLQVHEPITKQPDLISTSTPLHNESCTVFLECRAASDSNVTFKWTVRNQTRSGSTLKYTIKAQDGDTEFICTIHNYVSEMSASKIVECNETQKTSPVNFVIILSMAGGGCLLLVFVVGIVVCVCHRKQSQPDIDSNDVTVYADISEVAIENENSCAMKPCSVYETIDNRVNSVPPGPQTVYDKIQLSRVRKPSVSPYHEVS